MDKIWLKLLIKMNKIDKNKLIILLVLFNKNNKIHNKMLIILH